MKDLRRIIIDRTPTLPEMEAKREQLADRRARRHNRRGKGKEASPKREYHTRELCEAERDPAFRETLVRRAEARIAAETGVGDLSKLKALLAATLALVCLLGSVPGRLDAKDAPACELLDLAGSVVELQTSVDGFATAANLGQIALEAVGKVELDCPIHHLRDVHHELVTGQLQPVVILAPDANGNLLFRLLCHCDHDCTISGNRLFVLLNYHECDTDVSDDSPVSAFDRVVVESERGPIGPGRCDVVALNTMEARMPRKPNRTVHARCCEAMNAGKLVLLRVKSDFLAPIVRDGELAYLIEMGTGREAIDRARMGKVYLVESPDEAGENSRMRLFVLRGRRSSGGNREAVFSGADVKRGTIRIPFATIGRVWELVMTARVLLSMNEISGTLPERSVAKVGAQSDRKANGATAAV